MNTKPVTIVVVAPQGFFGDRLVKTQLYQITSADPRVLAVAVITLAIAACVAGILPARRAASIDPVRALRME